MKVEISCFNYLVRDCRCLLHLHSGNTSYRSDDADFSSFSRMQYEHSSIPATVKAFFGLPQGFLTARDAWAAPFHTLASLDAPRTDCPTELNQFVPIAGMHDYRA